jgi:hypothetical protein
MLLEVKTSVGQDLPGLKTRHCRSPAAVVTKIADLTDAEAAIAAAPSL